MVRVGRRSGNTYPKRTITVHQGSITQTREHHYGAEPSFHRSASVCKPALVLVRAYITPRTRLKPPYRAFNDHRKGKDPIYSQSLLDYLCRCLLCTDTPVTDLNQFCAGVTKPSTHKMNGNWLTDIFKNERGIYFKYRAVIINAQHDSLSWILCRSQNHITFVINCFSN